MSDQSATRQRYRLATGQGLTPAPPRNPNPGFKRGGGVRKQAGGSCYSKGGSSKKR